MTGTELAGLLSRVGPILAFLVAITIVAEIADLAGVFDVAAQWAARAARYRVWVLWLLIVAIACASTIFLSLDTTAVLLTPVAITVARRVGAPPLPFAMATLWLANTASLLLPVSNLTNLFALDQMNSLGVGHRGFVTLPAAPAAAAILATVVLLAVRHRLALWGSYTLDVAPNQHDNALLVLASVCCLCLGPAFAVGVTPAVASAAAATVLIGAVLLRRPSLLRQLSVPWRGVLALGVRFGVVQVALDHGLHDVLTSTPRRPRLDQPRLERLAQRRPGIVAMPAGQLDQLIEDLDLLGPARPRIRGRPRPRHSPALTHRQPHGSGRMPDPHRPPWRHTATRRFSDEATYRATRRFFVSQRAVLTIAPTAVSFPLTRRDWGRIIGGHVFQRKQRRSELALLRTGPRVGLSGDAGGAAYPWSAAWTVSTVHLAVSWWALTGYTQSNPGDCPGGVWRSNETNIWFNYNTMKSLSAWGKRVVATHETGHAYGLAHTAATCGSNRGVMQQGSGKFSCAGTPPWTDDVNGVNAKY